MTIDILLEALEELRDSRSHPDYKEHVIERAISELKNLSNNISNPLDDVWHGAVHVMFIDDAINIQNATMYDAFGKLAKEGKGDFCNYCLLARSTYGFEHASTYFLRSGYDVLNDLWHDNEQYGHNNPDGTYCRDAEGPG